MPETTIHIRDNGPYIVRGASVLKDASGNVLAESDDIALCRCGLSANKPFCDSTHKRQGFQSAPRG